MSSIKPINEKYMVRILKTIAILLPSKITVSLVEWVQLYLEILAKNNLRKNLMIHGIQDDFVDSDTPSSLESIINLT